MSLLLSCFFFLAIVPPAPAMLDGASTSCSTTEIQLIAKAFKATRGLKFSDFYNSTLCTANKTEIHLPSRNITGVISWMSLNNVSNLRLIDLSRNHIYGSIPTHFWISNSIRHLNLASNRLGGVIRFNPGSGGQQRSSLRNIDLSDNRLTNCVNMSGFPHLTALNLSGNRLRNLPVGIDKLDKLKRLDLSRCNISGEVKGLHGVAASLRYLDLSRNKMTGVFKWDLPAMDGLVFLNVSFNNFSGFVETQQYRKFGSSAFVSSGLLLRLAASSTGVNSTLSTHKPSHGHKMMKKKKKTAEITVVKKKEKRFFSKVGILWVSICGGGAVGIAGILFICCCIYNKKKRKEVKEDEKRIEWMKTASRFGTEAAWVAAMGRTSTGKISPVIMFEKPLMNLTFSDLIAATSGFGKESQLAEGKESGRQVYRAILPGDIDVAIKVLDKAGQIEGVKVKSTFQEVVSIKHPNVLPLLGYCIAGKKTLLLYEYMKNGDLHRWLHELPMLEIGGESAMEEDWNIPDNAYAESSRPRTESGSWPTRYRIALGIARGLAFLHHAARKTPIVHGRVESSNVLLNEDLVPAITWAGINGNDADEDGNACAESDVYGFGVVLMELLTGQIGSETAVKSFRDSVRDETGLVDLDPRIRIESDLEEKEIMESKRVAYLCTAELVQKRPSMNQIVGVLKDIRRLPV